VTAHTTGSTSRTHRLKRIVALTLTAVLIGALLTPIAASAGEAPNEDGFVELDSEVSVWTSASIAMELKDPAASNDTESPLLTDTIERSVDGSYSDGTAVAGQTNNGVASVVSGDSMVRFDFGSQPGAETEQFADTEVSLVVAELDDGADPSVSAPAELATKDAAELLVADDRNDRATFETQFTADDSDDMRVIDDDGHTGYYYDLDDADHGSGVYGFYAVETVSGDGFSADDGELAVDGEVRILGVDTVAVHDAESTVETNSEYEAGDTLEFDVSAEGDSVDHTIAVFDEAAVANEQLTLESGDTDIDAGLEPADLTVSTSADAHGVANVDGATAFGSSVADSPAYQSSEVGMLFGYVSTTAADDNDGPAASIASAADTGGNGTLSVETLDDWDAGEYTYVHVATAEDGTTTTTSGSVTLSASTDAGETEPESTESESDADGSGLGIILALGALIALLIGVAYIARQQ